MIHKQSLQASRALGQQTALGLARLGHRRKVTVGAKNEGRILSFTGCFSYYYKGKMFASDSAVMQLSPASVMVV